jgi:hypothetical protein
MKKRPDSSNLSGFGLKIHVEYKSDYIKNNTKYFSVRFWVSNVLVEG